VKVFLDQFVKFAHSFSMQNTFVQTASNLTKLTIPEVIKNYRDVAYALAFEHNVNDPTLIGFVRAAIAARHNFVPSVEFAKEVLQTEGIRLLA
jgi:hypothetical protein